MIYYASGGHLQYTKGHKLPYFFHDSEASKENKWTLWTGRDFESVSPKMYVASGWVIAAPTQMSWWEE